MMRFLRKVARPRSLRYELHRHLGGRRPERSHRVVHASDLMSERRPFCERQYALMDVLGLHRDDVFQPTAQSVAFEVSALTAHLVTAWAAAAGVARGQWRCVACGRVHAFGRRPARCVACGCPELRYVEPVFVSRHSGVSGSFDLLVHLGEPRLRVYEIKVVQPQDFKKLVGPLAEHRWRTNLYLRLAAESGSPLARQVNLDRAWVLYVAKGGYGERDERLKEWRLHDGEFSPFKEYAVARYDAETEERVARARQVLLFRQGKGPMPDGICATSVQAEAKACPVVGACFSGKYPPGAMQAIAKGG